MLNRTHPIIGTAATLAIALAAGSAAFASSHREAPFITQMPKVDGTDFYMFRSYEDGDDGMVTIIANYQPLQDAYGGPNYFAMDPNALYEIHIDNNGDAQEDLTFQFRFDTQFNNAALPIGPDGDGVTIPLVNSVPDGIGPGATDLTGVNRTQTYQVTMQTGDRRSNAQPTPLTNLGNTADQGAGSDTFRKPIDFIGENSFNGSYEDYAQNHIYGIDLGACGEGRVFVGQRQEGFVINLGEVFDLINIATPVGADARDDETNIVGDKNVTSIAMEVPSSCLTDGDPVVGGWTTASLRQARVLNPFPDGPSASDGETGAPSVEGGPWVQVSRLGNPLVNEVVIGIDQKDRFNHSEPVGDPQFLDFVTHPVLPAVANSLFETAIPETPRNDLVSVFLTGVAGLNQPQAITDGGGAPGEILRLNTDIAPTPPATQSDMGVLACDLAGFPNGRRPYDDVTDIALTAALGALTPGNPNSLQFCDTTADGGPAVVNGGNIVTDGARALGPTASTPNESTTTGGVTYLDRFPYLNTPLPGSRVAN